MLGRIGLINRRKAAKVDPVALAQRTSDLVRTQRITDGRDTADIEKVSTKELAESGVGVMTLMPGMTIPEVDMRDADIMIDVQGGEMSGRVQTRRPITVTKGVLSGHIETSGDLNIYGGKVSGLIIARRILVQGSGRLEGACVSNTIITRDGGRISAEIRPADEATDEWKQKHITRSGIKAE